MTDEIKLPEPTWPRNVGLPTWTENEVRAIILADRAQQAAQVSAEPVAWGLFAKVEDGSYHLQHPIRFTLDDAKSDRSMYERTTAIKIEPLYTQAPIQAQPQAELAGAQASTQVPAATILDGAQIDALAREHGVYFKCLSVDAVHTFARAVEALSLASQAEAQRDADRYSQLREHHVVAVSPALEYGLPYYYAAPAGMTICIRGDLDAFVDHAVDAQSQALAGKVAP